MKSLRIFLLAIISGIITTGIFYLYIKDVTPASTEEVDPIEMVEVVVATTDIASDNELTKENTTLKSIKAEVAHEAAVKDQTKVIGQYTSSEIKSGEIVMNHRIRKQEDEVEIVSRKINEDMRAVSIDVDYDESVSNLNIPEDYVDVILTVKKEESDEIIIETKLLFEKVRVLAVGERIVNEPKQEEEDLYFTVTLELSQKDTVKLVNASHSGDIHLSLYSKLNADNEDKQEKTSEKEKSQTSRKPADNKDSNGKDEEENKVKEDKEATKKGNKGKKKKSKSDDKDQ